MIESIFVKKGLFSSIKDIEAVIQVIIFGHESYNDESTRGLPKFDLLTKTGVLNNDSVFDVEIKLRNSSPAMIKAITTALEYVLEGKKIDVK